MRRASIAAVVLVPLLAACGSGQSPVVDGAGTTSTTVAVVAGDTTAPAPGDTTATTAAATGLPDAAAVDPATVETTPPADPEAPAPVADSGNPPPALGRYTFHTTGSASQGLQQQAIDEQTVTIITSLGGGDIRQAAEDGSQIIDLRYQADGVFVRLLDLAMEGARLTFRSPEGVLFTPVPATPGQSWTWQLTDDTGQITAAWSATTQPAQTISAAGETVEAAVVDALVTISGAYSGVPVAATVHFTLWLDPARRTAVQIHQVTDVTQPAIFAGRIDTTSVLTGFTPA